MRLFLTYSLGHGDEQAYYQLLNVAGTQGVEVLVPKRIPNLRAAISDETRSAIEQSDAVCGLITARGVDQHWMLSEIRLGLSQQKPCAILIEKGISILQDIMQLKGPGLFTFERHQLLGAQRWIVEEARKLEPQILARRKRAEQERFWKGVAAGAVIGALFGLILGNTSQGK